MNKIIENLRIAGLSGSPGKPGNRRHVAMWNRANFKCEYCGYELLKDLNSMRGAQLDHLLPQSRYPELKDIDDNWVLSCYSCNQFKRDFDPSESLKAPITTSNLFTHRTEFIKLAKDQIRLKSDPYNIILKDIKSKIEKK